MTCILLRSSLRRLFMFLSFSLSLSSLSIESIFLLNDYLSLLRCEIYFLQQSACLNISSFSTFSSDSFSFNRFISSYNPPDFTRYSRILAYLVSMTCLDALSSSEQSLFLASSLEICCFNELISSFFASRFLIPWAILSFRATIIFPEGCDSVAVDWLKFQLCSVRTLVLKRLTLCLRDISSSSLSLSSRISRYLLRIWLAFMIKQRIQCLRIYYGCIITIVFKMNQKKKNPPSNAGKKLGRVRSENNFPIGTLMQELGQLKQEVRSIKQQKKQQNAAKPQEQKIIQQNKQNKSIKQINFIELQCLSRQLQLKGQIQLNKLRRALQSQDSQRMVNVINQLFSMLNRQLKEITNERNRFKMEIDEMIFIHQAYRKQQTEKNRILTKNNQILQHQMKRLKEEVSYILEEETKKEQQKKMVNDQAKIKEELLLRQRQELMKNNEEMEMIIQEWELQCRALKEKNISYQKNIQNKTEAVIFLEEDIKYLRVEVEKYKNEKKQIQKLWEKSTSDAKQMKKIYQDQIERLEREKSKWMNQCALRRHQSEQIQSIQGQKSMLIKQVQQLRNSFSLKCKQFFETKTTLHQVQKKMIGLQSQNYRLSQQTQKGKRQKQLWQRQISSLRGQVEGLQEINMASQQYRIKAVKSIESNQIQAKARQQKLKALEDIHALIQQHKNDIQEQQ